MPTRENLLLKLWRKLRGQRPRPVPLRARKQVRKAISTLEPLEGRIAPAALINPMTITYHDLDNDLVTVKLTKAFTAFAPGTAGAATAVDAIFKFADASGNVSAFGDSGPQQLQLINLQAVVLVAPHPGQTPVNPVNTTSLTVAATPITGVLTPGNGFTEIGAIQAGGLVLGTVSIDGDLGQIDAGGPANITAIKLINARTIGAAAGITQSGVPDFESHIVGALGGLTVTGNVDGFIHVVNRTNFLGQVDAPGNVGNVTVGGSFFGSTDATSGKLGTVEADGSIGVVKVGGSLLGGGTALSGSVIALNGKITSVSVGTTAAPGNIVGGGAANTGIVFASTTLGSLTVTGNLTGGGAFGAGSVRTGGDMGAVKILGDINGGTFANTGWISAGRNLASVTLGDSIDDNLTGGTGQFSALIAAGGTMGAVKISGSIIGDGSNSGALSAGGKIASVTIGGSFVGGLRTDGTSDGSGFISTLTDIGAVKIAGDMKGGGGTYSGTIIATGKLTSVSIGGQLMGGVGANSGVIFSSTDPDIAHDLGSVIISKGIVGGAGPNSGSVIADGKILSITVGSLPPLIFGVPMPALQGGMGTYSGSIIGHSTIGTVKITGDIVGGGVANSGSIQAVGNLATATVSGSLRGGAGNFSGTIISHEQSVDGANILGTLGKITVGGGLFGGGGDHSGAIEAEGNLGTVTVGSIKGGAGDFSGSVLAGSSLENGGSATLVSVTGSTTLVGVNGSVEGGAGMRSGTIEIDGTLASLKVKNDVKQSAVRAADAIKLINIGGNLENSIISARGQAVPTSSVDLALGPITIGGTSLSTGKVTGSQILAGYDLDGAAVNRHAQIGAVKVTHDWTASSLIAGVADTNSNGFGNSDDALIALTDGSAVISKIASITIGGAVTGTPDATSSTDSFGFEAQQIGAVKIAGVTVARPITPFDVIELDSANHDTFLREIAPATGG